MTYVLTEAHNDHNQHGEYFIACWQHQPDKHDLYAIGISGSDADDVLNFRGRVSFSVSVWHNLHCVADGERISGSSLLTGKQ
jgi:hypothetical protein